MRILENEPAGHPHILYGIDGRPEATESALPNLEGYRCSAPVRIRNGTATRRQLDVCEEILATVSMDAVNQTSGVSTGSQPSGPSQ
jgi:hypothetical protein